ncbi:inner nuclear membrane protein enriched at telomere/subtelomere region [Coemansia interrupta]|uniref:Inner nuclear membrane protein enriched at telomere/subtelomere region n=1 Tax=Coemansia interrupta TaxID=1126814 RepID=A0A9W8H729_9FUNG|nr:inner nuclear membrane protein enriched at telomere/subtelomere region [Coemansia interrupta]
MDADESKYLEAGFDAAALKVSSLRNILVKHNVDFPSNAKKPELVAIFGRKIAARAAKLRKDAGRARKAKGDGRAIEVVDGGAAADGSGEHAGGSKRKLSDVEKDEPRRRKKKSSGKRRVLAAAAQAAQTAAQAASESEADEADESRRRRKKKKVDAATLLGSSPRAAEAGNFSDDNPFQAAAPVKKADVGSPEQRRTPRKTPAKEAAGGTTPLAALRKSQQSDVAFRVALPAARAKDTESVKSEPREIEPKEAEPKQVEPQDVEMLEPVYETSPELGVKPLPPSAQPMQPLFPPPAQPTEPQPTKPQPTEPQQQQQQPRKQRLPDLPPPPKFDLSRAPALRPPTEPAARPAAGGPSRLSMTPDALRQMAADRKKQEQPVLAAKPPPMPGLAADDVHVLQRRRVATLRQHVEAAGDSHAAPAHSRRSSIASIADVVGEARGVPAEPAASEPAAAATPPGRRAKRPSFARRLALLTLLGLAGVGWRAHEQLQLGFRNTRAGEPALPPPADSMLAEPAAPTADIASLGGLGDHLAYAARLARARYFEPAALECPEHATCTPYVAAADAAAVQCDAGYVLQRPAPERLRAPVCVRDVPLEHRVRQLSDAIVRVCDERRGQAQCAQSLFAQARAAMQGAEPLEPADEADEVERLGVSVDELRGVLEAQRAPGVPPADFDRAFGLAVRALADGARPDALASFVVEYEDAEEATFLVSRRAALPPLCRLRRLALGLLLGNARRLALAASGLLAGVLAVRRLGARRAESRAADALVHAALRRLRRQARQHYVDPAFSPSPAIPSVQLRDLLLLASSSEARLLGADAYFDPRARASVWERVRRVVERSANVRCRTTAVRGEPMRVWEWIGPLDAEDAEDEGEAVEPPLNAEHSAFASPKRLSAAFPATGGSIV